MVGASQTAWSADLSRLRDHLNSPQYPDEEPLPDDAATQRGMSMVKITGGWVQPGKERWRAYVLFALSFIGGLLLALTSTGDNLDIIAMMGLGFVAFGLFGLAETVTGKVIWRPVSRSRDD